MRVLFLTHRLPYAPNRGDRIRAYYLLREMSRFADVSLFSLVHDADELAHAAHVPFAADVQVARVAKVRNLLQGVLSLPTSRPLTHALLDAAGAARAIERLADSHPPDLVVAYCSGMARFALQTPLSAHPCVIDMVDLDSAKWASLAREARGVRRWIYRREAATLRAFEVRAIRHARATLVVNERERDALLQIAPAAPAIVIPNGIDLQMFAPPDAPADAPLVVFCGVMSYYPNVEGVLWFAQHVWPLVLAEQPHARFAIVGASPSRAIEHLRADPSIEVVGAVSAVQPYLWRSAVSVAPVRLARGLQNKVLEAIAAGLPVVVAPAVLEGLPAHVRRACLSASEPGAFANAVLRLLRLTPIDRRACAASANLADLEWTKQLAPLENILRG